MRIFKLGILLLVLGNILNQANAKTTHKYNIRVMKSHKPKLKRSYMEGIASHYAMRFDGHKTSSGENLDLEEFSAAHPTLPLNTKLKVTNLVNKRFVYVWVNDRMPRYSKRVIDLTFAPAKLIGIYGGLGKVKLEKVSNQEFESGLKQELEEYNMLKTLAISGILANTVINLGKISTKSSESIIKGN